MTISIMSVLESLFLVIALTTDTFVASFAYGTNKIKIPVSSICIMTVISSATLCIAILAGSLVRPYLPVYVTKSISFLILMVLGIVKLFDSSVKACIRKHKCLQKKISFSVMHLNFILDVYADPEIADCDCSNTLSPKEAVALALAVSIDGLAVGFGSALMHISLLPIMIFAILFGFGAVKIGCTVGNRLSESIPFDLSWLSGVLLIILAVIRL